MPSEESHKDASHEGHELAGRLNVLLPGLYAWVSTVASPAASRAAPHSARLVAGLALAALVAGTFSASRRPRLGRGIAVYGFVGLCGLAWLLLGPVLSVERIEPVRSAFGSIGWALFAFGWGAVRNPGAVPEDHPRAIAAEPLKPRGKLARTTSPTLIAALLGATIPMLLAWQVVRPRHALLAHAAALAAAIALVTVGAEVAVAQGKWRGGRRPSQRLASAAVPLTALAVLGLVGLVRWLVG